MPVPELIAILTGWGCCCASFVGCTVATQNLDRTQADKRQYVEKIKELEILLHQRLHTPPPIVVMSPDYEYSIASRQ